MAVIEQSRTRNNSFQKRPKVKSQRSSCSLHDVNVAIVLTVCLLGVLTGLQVWASTEVEASTKMTQLLPAPAQKRTLLKHNNEQSSRSRLFMPSELKLPTPIIVMGLMKAGTTSIFGYFKCGLDPKFSQLSHYDCHPQRNLSNIGMSCGKRMRRNIEKMHKPIFDGLDQFHLYAEIDAQEGSGGMTLPQHRFLPEIHDQFPNSTWILNTRDPQAWLSSINRWLDLRQRFIDHHSWPDFPRGVGAKDEEMIDFYNLQAQKVRDFVKEHPSHALVEVRIDRPDAAQLMEDAFGISKTCWGNKNKNDGNAVWGFQ